MRIVRSDPDVDKGWYVGPWNSDLGVSIGYAHAGVDEPHLHRRMREVYVVARGSAELRAEKHTVLLHAGDLVLIEPGEAHTFLASTPDYYHLVIHTPALDGEEARADKAPVSRERLGLV
jgi:quercetin dioxygenase-like cupin family protein